MIVSHERQLIVFADPLGTGGQRFACVIALGRRQCREGIRTKQRKSILSRHDPSRSRVAVRQYGARFSQLPAGFDDRTTVLATSTYV